MLTASTPGAPPFTRTFSHASKMRRFRISNDFNFGFGLSLGSSPAGLTSRRYDLNLWIGDLCGGAAYLPR
jgi:hypothetical protein